MITKEAQCKIITDYLNASGIVNQFLNDTIMDALDGSGKYKACYRP